MKAAIILIPVLVTIGIPSCGRQDGAEPGEANRKATEARNKEALESLRHIEEREARNSEVTGKMKNAPLQK